MNRGGHTISEIIATCKAKGVTDVVVLHETRGQPGTYYRNNDRLIIIIIMY